MVVNLVEDIPLGPGILDESGYNLEFCCASFISKLSSSLSLVPKAVLLIFPKA